jgi:hypothetical protein
VSDRLRLRDVDPDSLTKDAGQALLQDATAKLAALNSGELAAALQVLVAYARGDLPMSQAERKRMTACVALLWASPVAPAEVPKTDTPIGLVVAAVQARAALDAGEDIGCPEISLLTGYASDHVASLAQEIPGHYRDTKDRRKPWRFKASAALRRWIKDRTI